MSSTKKRARASQEPSDHDSEEQEQHSAEETPTKKKAKRQQLSPLQRFPVPFMPKDYEEAVELYRYYYAHYRDADRLKVKYGIEKDEAEKKVLVLQGAYRAKAEELDKLERKRKPTNLVEDAVDDGLQEDGDDDDDEGKEEAEAQTQSNKRPSPGRPSKGRARPSSPGDDQGAAESSPRRRRGARNKAEKGSVDEQSGTAKKKASEEKKSSKKQKSRGLDVVEVDDGDEPLDANSQVDRDLAKYTNEQNKDHEVDDDGRDDQEDDEDEWKPKNVGKSQKQTASDEEDAGSDVANGYESDEDNSQRRGGSNAGNRNKRTSNKQTETRRSPSRRSPTRRGR